MAVKWKALGLLWVCPYAFALNPALDVSQYAHTSWKVRDGFTKGEITSIAQTPDGYLWLGTEFGLTRFDGVHNVPWEPPAGQHLPSNSIKTLLTARDGTLWIGTTKGLASWKGGKLTPYAELAGRNIIRLAEDRLGRVWAGELATRPGRICAIEKGSVQCFGHDGSLGNGVYGLYKDSKDNLWVGVHDGLWRWRPGPPKFFPLPIQPDGFQGLAEGEDGDLLVSMTGAIRRFVDGKTEVAYPFPTAMGQLQAQKLFRDRDGGLWIGTTGSGLAHVHQGRTDVFVEADGLSGDDVTAFYEDREGSVWVATHDGLDRFRDYTVATFSANQGLSNGVVSGVLAATDGSVWVRTSDGLRRWNRGRVTAYREREQRGTGTPANVHEIVGSGLPDHNLSSLFQDARGRIWVATPGGVGYLEDDRFITANGVPGGIVHAFAEDREGNLWIANQDLGLYRLSPGNEVQQIPWAELGHKESAVALAADLAQHGLWLGFYSGGVAFLKDGQVRASYSAAGGLGAGRVDDLRFDGDGTLWASTEGGLSRLRNGRVATLTTKNGLPCDAVHWTMEDNDHSFWLGTACGLVRIARSELDAWLVDPSRRVRTTLFDSSDGIRSSSAVSFHAPHVGKSPDGKLWFRSEDGLSVVDPSHLPFNKLRPPVNIEQITADRQTYAADAKLPLPALIRDLEIDYTALSLVAPEKMQFRYKLEGYDRDWHEAGARRQAVYGNLPPRNYRFRVTASNNSGVWNEAGASLDFVVPPAYYQTTWFRASVVAAFLALLAGIFQMRLRNLRRQFEIRMEERVNERTRIARDLHDTLLQSLAGVSLQLDGISKRAATAPEKIPSLISRVRDQVDSCFREARSKVWELRSPALEDHGLAGALRKWVEQIGPDHTARCGVTISGHPRSCPPDVEEELLRIAQEATNNANRHAQAKEILIALEYHGRSVKLTISDDGRGFDLEEGYRKTGHWGLKNMHERAARIGGTCKITTALGRGTHIEIGVSPSRESSRTVAAT